MADGTSGYDIYLQKVKMAMQLAGELPASIILDTERLKPALQGIWEAVHETIPTRVR